VAISREALEELADASEPAGGDWAFLSSSGSRRCRHNLWNSEATRAQWLERGDNERHAGRVWPRYCERLRRRCWGASEDEDSAPPAGTLFFCACAGINAAPGRSQQYSFAFPARQRSLAGEQSAKRCHQLLRQCLVKHRRRCRQECVDHGS